jgi:hypothetical protein
MSAKFEFRKSLSRSRLARRVNALRLKRPRIAQWQSPVPKAIRVVYYDECGSIEYVEYRLITEHCQPDDHFELVIEEVLRTAAHEQNIGELTAA